MADLAFPRCRLDSCVEGEARHAQFSGSSVDLLNSPFFSVVIPTYQRRDVVCAAVRAFSKMDFSGRYELIIVVDGSTDGTVSELMKLSRAFPLNIIEQKNAGAAAARNRGAEAARGEILLFLDDDMIAQPDLLEEHARMYRDNADAVIGNTPLDEGSTPGFLSDCIRRWFDIRTFRSPLTPWDIFTGQLSVRSSVFKQIGGFDEALTADEAFANEDTDLGVRLLERFDVRENPDAISRQRYVVTPREDMARSSKAAIGELRFIAKHPQYSREFFNARGLGTKLGRYVYLPLSRLKPIARFIRTSAVWVAELGLKTPLRSNRVLARYFSGARSVAFWSAIREKCQLPGSERLLVLCYHAMRDLSDDPVLAHYGVAPLQFTQHLDMLNATGFNFVSPDTFANWLVYGAPLPKKAVLLTFDDCYSDLLDTAREILRPRDISALAFAVTGTRSGTHEWDQPTGARQLTLLSAEQIRELASLGVEIGSHSRSHRDLPSLSYSEMHEESAGSATDLERMGLPRPRFFAYPFGATDAKSRAVVVGSGYVAAFGCGTLLVSEGSDRFNLPRIVVHASDRGLRFRLKATAPYFFVRMERLYHAARTRIRARRMTRAIY